jgi:hypothetical protein
MLARARQKREGENKPEGEKREEEKKKSATTGPDTASRTGAGHIESFAEWRARRAREEEAEERKAREERENAKPWRRTRREEESEDIMEESQIFSTLPPSVKMRLLRERRERREREERTEREKRREIDTTSGSTPSPGRTSASKTPEAEKTEEPRRPRKGPNFKVNPLPKATAPTAQATPTTDQPGRRSIEKTLKPTAAEKKVTPVAPAPVPEPAPTPAKRKGPNFKVPPLSAVQRAAL